MTQSTRQAARRSRIGEETGLLCDIEILNRVVADDDYCIFVSPLVDALVQVGPSSLDLHLGNELAPVKRIYETHIDLTAERSTVERQTRSYLEKQEVIPGGTLVLHPGELALGSTLEFFRLPLDIAARLEGRSSFGRLGLQVHATAGFVDPGFEGTLTFELINAGRLPLVLSPGIRLGQICFYRIGRAEVGYLEKARSKYGRRLGVEGSRIAEDL